MISHHTPHDDGVAMIGWYEGSCAVVEIPEGLATAGIVPQDLFREIGTLQVLRPRAVEAIDTLVHHLQRIDLIA